LPKGGEEEEEEEAKLVRRLHRLLRLRRTPFFFASGERSDYLRLTKTAKKKQRRKKLTRD
jgi:hypothetical protein